MRENLRRGLLEAKTEDIFKRLKKVEEARN